MKRFAGFTIASVFLVTPLFAAEATVPGTSDWSVVVLVALVGIVGRIVDLRKR